MKRIRRPLLFALMLLPVAAVGAYFTALYQLDMFDEATRTLMLEQMGSEGTFVLVYIVQILLYVLAMGFFGYILADKLGLMRPIRLEKKPLLRALALSGLAGILFSLDYWTFGRVYPAIAESAAATPTPAVMLASILYGGVVEEIMLRLFFMSLLAWLGWKFFFRRSPQPPRGVIIAANILAALLFAAGHLPATRMIFGSLTPLLLLRCFLLNGGFGLLFGYLYHRFGIQYAMIGHAMCHVISKAIWLVFI